MLLTVSFLKKLTQNIHNKSTRRFIKILTTKQANYKASTKSLNNYFSLYAAVIQLPQTFLAGRLRGF